MQYNKGMRITVKEMVSNHLKNVKNVIDIYIYINSYNVSTDFLCEICKILQKYLNTLQNGINY